LNLSNATGQLDKFCLMGHNFSHNPFLCSFAPKSYPFALFASFVINSKFDSKQISCIFAAAPPLPTGQHQCSAFPNWKNCVANPLNCNENQMIAMNDYASTFLNNFNASLPENGIDYGAFIDNSYEHCGGIGKSWSTVKIKGVTMHDAVLKWWNDTTHDPVANMHICQSNYPNPC